MNDQALRIFKPSTEKAQFLRNWAFLLTNYLTLVKLGFNFSAS